MPLTLLLLTPALLAAQVDLATDTLLALRPPVDSVQAAPAPRVARRDLAVTMVDGGLQLRCTWKLDAVEAGWLTLDLVGLGPHVTRITWRGRDLDGALERKQIQVAVEVDGPGELSLDAFVPGDVAKAPIVLQLLAAPLGTVTAEGLEVADAVQVDGTWWTGAELLLLRQPIPVRRGQGTLVVAHGGLGLTVRDDSVLGRARLVWEVRQGELERVSFTLPGAGRDLDVTGAGLREWRRSGDRIIATLQAPTDGRVTLEARWTNLVPAGTEASLVVPALELEGAWRSDVSLRLARDGELEVLPTLPRWDAIARSALPDWGQGLVEGTPTASYVATTARPGRLQLLRFKPVSAPAVVVDVVAHTAALSVEGRVLGRSLYQVRNERASHLRVVLPPGARLVGLRVGPRVATPVSDGEPGVLVPLLRSVETVQGLLSFPVEVVWFLEIEPWTGGSRRDLPFPVIDAPVGVQRTTVYLPMGFRAGGQVGSDDRVAAFSEGDGITYGLGTGDPLAVLADEIFQDAVTSWLENEFDEAQAQLDDLRELGAANEDILRLQSNLDLLFAEPTPAAKEADKGAERRVRAQARARSSGKSRAQKQVAVEADEAARSGDYERAERLYMSALEMGEDLEALEEEESVEQRSLNREYSANLRSLEKKKAAKAAKAPTADSWWHAAEVDEQPGFLDLDEEEAGWFEVAEEPFLLGGQLIGGEDELVMQGYGASSGGVGYGSASAGMGATQSGGRSGEYTVDEIQRESSLGGRSNFSADYRSKPGNGLLGARIPAPVVTASALSVTIPAAGQAVHYQRLLLPAGAPTEVVLDARLARLSWRSR